MCLILTQKSTFLELAETLRYSSFYPIAHILKVLWRLGIHKRSYDHYFPQKLYYSFYQVDNYNLSEQLLPYNHQLACQLRNSYTQFAFHEFTDRLYHEFHIFLLKLQEEISVEFKNYWVADVTYISKCYKHTGQSLEWFKIEHYMLLLVVYLMLCI